MPRRIDLGRAVLLAGAVLLLVSLFLEWYDTGPTGWEVFEALDLVLAGLAIAAVAAALAPESWPRWAPWAIPAVALVIVVVQLIDAPPAAGDGSPSTGAWLALAGALLMTAGGMLSLSSISVTVQVRERELRRRVAAVDRRDRAERAAAGDDLADDPPRRDESLLRRDEPAARRFDAGGDELDRTQPLSALPPDDTGDVGGGREEPKAP